MCDLDQTFRREVVLWRGAEQQEFRIECFQMINDILPVIVKMDLREESGVSGGFHQIGGFL